MKIKILIFILITATIIFGINYSSKPFIPIDKSVKIDKIVVIKHKRILNIYSNNNLIKSYNVSLGSVPKGHKEFEGDKKTPEGLYFINDKNQKSGYHKNLGISYPNQKDIEKAKLLEKSPGGDIKIHGIRNYFGWIGSHHLLFDWTLGCIAVTNEEIDELYQIVPINTPIEILP